ncbi:MAG TPA: succinate dehydrogenase/fumarate reductase iron-sulfur subunit [Methanothermococcus okinawensis]|uniref:Succinate dehydrogenase/fumarate reductase iron-sulfur subunit n=1 Tax=Methanothermococcus okinawensis TaxID=155863 RepID=A0A832ZYL7_9EURY|nr:succinate dehydrogenase/fumarate reductase iron-sulfur subunit [Methanothermococcus okinawensis]
MGWVTIRVNRNGVLRSYSVPEGITVLEALEYINSNYGEGILYRASCRAGQCGSCAMTINGKPRLACKTRVEDGMVVEPLEGFNVVEDLVVDRTPYYKKIQGLRNYLHHEGDIPKITPEDMREFKGVRNCIDCLCCLSQCPARKFSQYPGPTFMRQLARFAFDPRDREDRERIAYFENLHNCTTCAKCVEVCPKEIDIVHRAIERLRELAFEKGYYLKNHLVVRENILKGWRSVKKEGESFLEKVKEEYIVDNEKMRLALFTGCLIDYRLQDVGRSAIKVLNAHGVSVVIPKDQVCCGSPLFRTGQRDVAEKLKRRNLKVFNSLEVDGVVTLCAGCGCTLKRDYREREFQVMDITQVLDRIPMEYKPLDVKVTYHDPCHLRRGQGIYLEPRRILKRIPGLKFVEMEIPDQCCGAGGGVRSGRPEVAYAIGRRKVRMIYKTGADYVITVCPFCEYHIEDTLKKFNGGGKKIEVINIVSLLEKVV